MAGIAHLNFFSGEKKKSCEVGNLLLQYGEKHSNIRSQVVGHISIGQSHFADGDLTKALSCYQTAVDIAQDPFYTTWPRLYCGICYFISNQFNKAEEEFNNVYSYMEQSGCKIFGPAILPFIGVIAIKKGDMSKGKKIIEGIRNSCTEKTWGFGMALAEYVLGNLYFQIAYGDKPGSLAIIKNFSFVAQNVPFASKKAEMHFNNSIETAEKFNAKGILGMTYMDLARLYRIKNKMGQARKCISNANHIFKQIDAQVFLEKTKGVLDDLEL